METCKPIAVWELKHNSKTGRSKLVLIEGKPLTKTLPPEIVINQIQNSSKELLAVMDEMLE